MKIPHVTDLDKFHNTAWFVYQDMDREHFFHMWPRTIALNRHIFLPGGKALKDKVHEAP